MFFLKIEALFMRKLIHNITYKLEHYYIINLLVTTDCFF